MKSAVVGFKFLVVALLLSATACTSPKAESADEIYFYPDKNVYYNPVNRFYFYSVDGGASWDSLRLPGVQDTSLLGPRTIIHANASNFVADNRLHRESYNAIVYNIVSKVDSTTTSTVTEKKLARKPAGVKAKPTEEPEKKKGLKKFFSKIFGKKKKE